MMGSRVRPEIFYEAALEGFDPLFLNNEFNMGYWIPGLQSKERASRILYEVIARLGEFEPSDRLLDVGCGGGAQDLYWQKTIGLSGIVGVDITPGLIETARNNLRASRVVGIDYQIGDATRLHYPEDSFSKIVGVESTLHFNTRDNFFKEAFRLLRPGGRLVLSDHGPLRKPANLVEWVVRLLDLKLFQIPPANFYGVSTLRDRIRAAGFVNVQALSIRERTLGGFLRYCKGEIYLLKRLRRKGENCDARLRTAKHFSKGWKYEYDRNLSDYIICYADKPVVRDGP